MTLAVLFFLGLLLVWILLPFLPSLREVQRKTDATPLPISPESEVNIRHLANRFRTLILVPLEPVLDRCRVGIRNEAGVLEDGTEYLAIGEDGDLTRARVDLPLRACTSMLLSSRELRLPPGSVCRQDVYAAGWIEGGRESVFRAILADGPIRLDRGCTTLRWMHSGESIRTEPGCRLFGRASADREIRIASSCRFERLHAPRIEFGTPVEVPAAPASTRVLSPRDLSKAVEDRAGRWLCRGGLKIGPGSEIRADLVVTGRLEIGWGSKILGSVKSHGDMALARGTTIEGSAISRRSLSLDKGCRVYGPVIAEKGITIASGCILGTASRLTTVSARVIRISPGVVCHGTVRANQAGLLSGFERVVAQAPSQSYSAWSDEAMGRIKTPPELVVAPAEPALPIAEPALASAEPVPAPSNHVVGPARAALRLHRMRLPVAPPRGADGGVVVLTGGVARSGELVSAASGRRDAREGSAMGRMRLPGPLPADDAEKGPVVMVVGPERHGG